MKRILPFTQRTLNFGLFRSYCSSAKPCPEVISHENPLKLQHFVLIHSLIGGNPEKVRNALMRNMKVQLMDEKTIIKKINIIKEMKLHDRNKNGLVKLLKFHERLLMSRYEVLRENGIDPMKMTSTLIRRYFSICKSTVHVLKKKELIDEDHKVLKTLWQIAGLDMNTYPGEADDQTLLALKEIVLKAYLRDKIKMSDEVFYKFEKEILFRLRNKGFTTMNANYNIFKNIIGLSRNRIQNNWFILYYDPSNVLDLLNRIKEVANVDMKTVLHIYPKIAAMPSENMENIVKYLEEENIPAHRAQRQMDIFTLNCNNLRQRLDLAKKENFFSMNMKSPRIVQLLHYQVKAKKRLAILEELKLYATVTCLSSSESFFEEFCEGGLRSFRNDILNYLTSELDINKEDLITKIKRHVRWQYVPTVHVARNLRKLRESYSDEAIKKYIYILFYYSEKLNRALQELTSHEGIDFFKEKGIPESEFALPLLLYILEKESNFTKESIWDQEEVNPYQDLPDLPEKCQSLEENRGRNSNRKKMTNNN